MFSRRSNSNGDALPSPRSGERTPLRSVLNEMLHNSTPSSRLKSRSLATLNVLKMTKSDISVCDPVPHSHCPPPTEVRDATFPEPRDEAPTHDATTPETACGLGDVTFKSFICTGGEVEISEPSMVTEDTTYLPKGQLANNTCEGEKTFISDSMINQSCGDHIEHPYCEAKRDATSVNIDTESLCEVSNTRPVFENVDDDALAIQESRIFQNARIGQEDVTFKSFICDGGEVEVSDVTRMSDETIPLPKAELWSHLPDESVNSSVIIDDGHQQCSEEHADHPYCNNESDLASSGTHFSTTTESSTGIEKLASGLSDITFKSFVCTGGEIEVSDATKIADETVPLLTNQFVSAYPLCDDSVSPGILMGDSNLQPSCYHADHPYCNIENDVSASGDLSSISEPLPCSLEVLSEKENIYLASAGCQSNRQGDITFRSFICTGGEVELSDATGLPEETIPLPKDQSVFCQLPCNDNVTIQGEIGNHSEHPYCHVEHDGAVSGIDPPAISEPSMGTTSVESVKDLDAICQVVQEPPKQGSLHAEDSAVPSVLRDTRFSNCDELGALGRSSTPVEVQEGLECNSNVNSRSEALESSGEKDSALGSTGNGPVPSNSLEELPAEKTSDVLTELPEFPSIPNTVQFELLSPIVRGTPLARIRVRRESALAQALAEDCALEGEKSLVAAVKQDPSRLWLGPLDSPMPRPLFNSTVLGTRSSYKLQSAPVKETAADERPCVVPQSEVEKGVVDIPLIPDGPLQQQLRQMAEFLIIASGKMGAALGPPLTAALTGTSAGTTSTECHSVGVGTTPVKLVDHSLNTSGQFERKREFSMVDSCTITDPLLWSVPPGSLESLPRQELELRLRSSMIMVEALVQQLATARGPSCPAAGPAPSDLRDRLVQTDHTELDQTTTYRDLYVTALDTIRELELDQNSLQNLIQCMQDTRATMTALRFDTDSALSHMKQIGYMVRGDQDSLVTQYGQMKSLHEKFKETQARMVQKVKDALHQREDMREQMKEAIAAKQAALSVTKQLRAHCDERISELEESVGSHQELMAALTRTYPEQVALNKAYVESLNSASQLLTVTMRDQASLAEELQAVRGLLYRTSPMLLKLNEKAAAALRERDQHLSDREQAVEERDQIQEELNQANLSLQDARQQIGDLNLQLTILNSEMGVFREKLSEGEEVRARLERKVTELSATVSSTLASYAFLEQALGAETTKLQESWKKIQQATDKATELEVLLGQSEQHVCELSQALAHSEEQLSQLQAHSHTQSLQIQQFQELCSQLNNVKEMNEFLQTENELAREQVSESEALLRANLQGLRERNLQCEDLKGDLSQLLGEKEALQAELETTRARADAIQLDLGEQLAQAVTDVTLLHHTLQGLTNELHSALSDKKPDPLKDKGAQPSLGFDRRHPSTSFVDSIMVALSAEKAEDTNTETPTGQDSSDVPEPQCEGLLSETSAFTRIVPVTPKKSEVVVEETCPEEEQMNVVELLADLGNTVSELVSTIVLVQQHKDAQLEELHNTILQGEQQAQASRHEAEVSELRDQLSRLSSLVEKGNMALQQKAQDEKTLKKLFTEVNESRELLNKYKTDNTELRKEVADLHCSLQQSQVESQALREEFMKADGQSANPVHFMDEKIRLLKEVERLRESLQKMEQARTKLLERAKRHQMVHQTNEQKMENELRVLDNMIDRVRKTLLSVPEVVNSCEQLKQLVKYIG